MKSAATQAGESGSLGARLKYVRGPSSQRAFADALGVAVGTYQNYERDDRLPDAALLARLIEMGWNANWLLSGIGPEHLKDSAPNVLPYATPAERKPVGVSDSQAGPASHPVQHDLAKIALQLVSEVLDDNHLTLPPEKRAELTLAVFELLQNGVPEAKLLRFVVAAVA